MLVLLEMVKRNAYRIARNFSALVLIQMTVDLVMGPIYYIKSLFEYGWYMIAGWQIEMMLTSPIMNIVEFAMLALMIQFIWEIFRAIWVISRFAFRKVNALRN